MRRFPSWCSRKAPHQLESWIVSRRSKAKHFGIEREDNFATFLSLSVMYGDMFVDEEWARSILSCVELHGPDKMALLVAAVEGSGAFL
jgi:hypothetical protein